jgi:Fic family protein
MDIQDFKSGNWLKGNCYRYFLPEPVNHSFVWTEDRINQLLEEASLKLGELNSFSRFVPDIDMFIKMHVLKEAVVSSRIEGTKTSIDEALAKEAQIEPERKNDWKEVHNYIEAMNKAIRDMKKIPFSTRLIRETHKILLSSVRGEYKAPGDFRTTQNWLGGNSIKDAVFIPPVHSEVPRLMSDLELFLHNDELGVPRLIRIAIGHYQFETIHPFLDGNGRIGRLMIPLYLVSQNILEKPLLYLSEYFEKDKTFYYDSLTFVRSHNDLGQWIRYFLNGIIGVSSNAVKILKKIVDMKDEIEINIIPSMGKRQKQATKLFEKLFSVPFVEIKDVQKITGLSPKAANDLVKSFVQNGILKETTGYQRFRVYVFENYIKLFR